MRSLVPLAKFDDRDDEREALISVHVRYLVAILGVVKAAPSDTVARRESIRFLDESLWAVTEIRPGLKYDTRYISEGVRAIVDEHNATPDWQYAGPNEDWHERTHPLKCSEHEHIVPRKQLRAELLAIEPVVAGEIERVLRKARACLVTDVEHAKLKLHGSAVCDGWERYKKSEIRVWDRTLGEWVAT